MKIKYAKQKQGSEKYMRNVKPQMHVLIYHEIPVKERKNSIHKGDNFNYFENPFNFPVISVTHGQEGARYILKGK
jgi:hypothetical protein